MPRIDGSGRSKLVLRNEVVGGGMGGAACGVWESGWCLAGYAREEESELCTSVSCWSQLLTGHRLARIARAARGVQGE